MSKVTLETLREGYPNLISEIEEGASKPLNDKIAKLEESLAASETKLVELEAKEKVRVACESAKSLLRSCAEEKGYDANEITDARIEPVLPYLIAIEEGDQKDAALKILEGWNITKSGSVKDLGARPDNTQTEGTDEKAAPKEDKKPKGYIPEGVGEDVTNVLTVGG